MSAVTASPSLMPTPVRKRRHLHVVPEPTPSPARAGQRLTVRGRRVLALACLLVLVGLTGAAAALAGGQDATDVQVRPGQTLSQVARQELPDLPAGEAVARIQQANGLNSLDVAAGQHLTVPRG